MNTMSSVSVIIPCYRQAHYLPEAIESVLSQSYPDIEVIVVNDGSDDDTDAVAARYAGRIRYVSKRNGGLSSARNAGIETATGQYLLFLDADDLLVSSAIERLVRSIEDTRTAAVMGWREFVGEPNNTGHEHLPPAGEILPAAVMTNPAPVHCWLVPRRAVVEVGGFKPMSGVEDWHLWGRLAVRGMNWRRVDVVGALYRKVPNSMSTQTMRMCKGVVDALAGIADEAFATSGFVEKWGVDLLRAIMQKRHWAVFSGLESAGTAPLTRQLERLVSAITMEPELRQEVNEHYVRCGRLFARQGRATAALGEYGRAVRFGSGSGVGLEICKVGPRWLLGTSRRLAAGR